ncbi:MAG: Zn-dependent hydrolase [Bacteroidales bacterium]|nr:Zn-dependent hydrolase [Bacteroidales bacterium]
MRNKIYWTFLAVFTLLLAACQTQPESKQSTSALQSKVDEFTPVKLKSDLLKELNDNQKELLNYLFDAASLIDDIFWKQAYGDKEDYLSSLSTEAEKMFSLINYGPWERLSGNDPFLAEYGPKPPGAQFYPIDMTKEEFEAFDNDSKSDLYTVIKRNKAGELVSVPYHEEYKEKVSQISVLLKKASELADDPGFKKYLELRSEALLNDDYLSSDLAWMDMKTNDIDVVIGPIENYEDGLYGYKTAFECYVLLKDKVWSEKLDRFASLLPILQKELPVPENYKQEVPGSDSDLGAYDAIFYAGDCNAGSKTIAINLPNDERVHIEKGSRKLQLKNSMKYKFEKILVPISKVVITKDQRKHIKFDAFFENTMFHEVAHGLGIKNTVNDKGVVRTALKEQYSALEEGKADILGLFLVTQLAEMGELGEKDLMDNYVTFMTSIFRSVRFGVASSHGKANMVRFYYFQEKGAFSKDEKTGTYRVDFEKMQKAMNDLANEIIIIQGNGDYEAAKLMIEENGYIRDDLQKDLDRISEAGIPRDIRFLQGKEIVGL